MVHFHVWKRFHLYLSLTILHYDISSKKKKQYVLHYDIDSVQKEKKEVGSP